MHLSGRLIHLLTYAPAGSVVAAPTTSLPERIGGNWNADYRLTWVRDASLSLTILSLLGNTQDAKRFMEWLCHRGSSTDAPLQVLYDVRGKTDPKPEERKDLYGYRGSKPVRFGNHAYHQRQHDAMGYLVDGALQYVNKGGDWRPEFSDLIRRVVNHLAGAWDQPDNSIWELGERKDYVAGKVMSWVAMDRAVRLFSLLHETKDIERLAQHCRAHSPICHDEGLEREARRLSPAHRRRQPRRGGAVDPHHGLLAGRRSEGGCHG